MYEFFKGSGSEAFQTDLLRLYLSRNATIYMQDTTHLIYTDYRTSTRYSANMRVQEKQKKYSNMISSLTPMPTRTLLP